VNAMLQHCKQAGYLFLFDDKICQQSDILPLLLDLAGDKFCPSHTCKSGQDLRLIQA